MPHTRTKHPAPRTSLLAAVVLCAACAAGASPRAPQTGLPVAAPDLDDAYDAEALPRLRLEEEGRLGAGDVADVDLARVGAVEVDTDGQVYFFEPLLKEIRVYSPEGEYLRSIGAPGSASGQFFGDVSFGISGDTVWTIDTYMRARRITFFDREGRVLSTAGFPGVPIELHSPVQRSWIVPLVRDADGLFVGDVGGGYGIATSAELRALRPADSISIPRVRFDLHGRVVDTVGFYPSRFRSSATEILSVGSSRYAVPSPLRDDPLEVREPGGRITVTRPTPTSAQGGTFRVTRTDFQGDSLQDLTFRYRPERYKPNALDSLAFRAARALGGSFGMLGPDGYESIHRFPQDSAAARPVIRAALRFPELQPPVQGYWLANDGGLWLKREDTPSERARWIVMDAELRPVGQLELPRTLRPLWSREDRVWVIETDAGNIPGVVRYRIRTAPVSD